MNVNVSVNTKGMEAACHALAKVSGKSIEEVVEAELAKVLDQAIVYTKSASRESIKDAQKDRQYTSQPSGLYTPVLHKGIRRGWKGRPVVPTKGGYVRYNLKFKYPTALWSKIIAARNKSLQNRYKAIGLAKKSWWIIGYKLGLPVRGGRFTSAVPHTGVEYPGDFITSHKSDNNGVAVAFTNAQPTINAIDGQGILQRAINGRVNFFLKNVKHGVFQSMQQIARAYPGLKLKP